MRKTVAVVAFLSLLGSCALAQVSDSHRVSVTVGETAWLGLSDPSGGPIDVNLVITFAAGDTVGTATDNSTRMDWGTNGTGYKVTLEEQLVNDGGNGLMDYVLEVTPVGLTRVAGTNAGTPVGTLTLDGSAGARDFITGVDSAVAFCLLQYDAEADVTDPDSTESRTVVYTITQ